jgi:hypothetical protein
METTLPADYLIRIVIIKVVRVTLYGAGATTFDEFVFRISQTRPLIHAIA